MFGIRFDVPNEYDHVLAHILENLHIEEYIWMIDYDDILVVPVIDNKELFRAKKLNGNEFQEDISKSIYYVCFTKILAFLSDEDIEPINTFSSFFNSKCKLMIFFTDAIFVEIYSMNTTLLNQLKENAEKYGYQNIQFIYEIGGKDLDLMDP